jgi:hypothetical protein
MFIQGCGMFSAGYLHFKPNCGAVYSKWCGFINNGWISLKLQAKYLRT